MEKREREGSWRDVGRERERRSEREREMIYALIVSQRVENLQLSRMRGSLLQVLFFFFFGIFHRVFVGFPRSHILSQDVWHYLWQSAENICKCRRRRRCWSHVGNRDADLLERAQ